VSLKTIARRGGPAVAAGLITLSCVTLSCVTTPVPARADCFKSNGGINDPTHLFATFDSCAAQVNLQIPKCSVYPIPPRGCYVDHYNIGFGQRVKSDEDKGPIFSGQRDRDGDKPFYIWGTTPKSVPVIAYFRFQDCAKGPIGPSDCDPWSDPLVIELGNNELTAR
jgi:hypothetical protein